MQKQAGENQKAASLEAELKTDSLKGVGGRGTMHLGKERGLEVLERRLAKLKNNKGKARASLLGRKGTPLVVSAGAGGSLGLEVSDLRFPHEAQVTPTVGNELI